MSYEMQEMPTLREQLGSPGFFLFEGGGSLFILDFSVWFWLKLAKKQCYDLNYLNRVIA